MRDVCADFHAELTGFNGEPGHAHLLVNFPLTVAISRLVNSPKECPPAVCGRNSQTCGSTRGGAGRRARARSRLVPDARGQEPSLPFSAGHSSPGI